MSQVKRFLQARRGPDATSKMLQAIEDVLMNSIRAVQPVMTVDPRCFEL